MDLVVELEENIEDNITINGTEYLVPDYGLKAHQIALFIFSVICLLPNLFIIYIILKNRLSSTIYWTIINWSVLNTLFLVNFLPLTLLPSPYLTLFTLEIILYFGVTYMTFTGILLTLFLFDFFVKSQKICKYSIAAVWCAIVFFQIIVFLVTSDQEIGSVTASIALEVILFGIVVAFVLRSIYSCVKPVREESYPLRVRLCTTYLVCLFLIWSIDFMVHVMHHYYILVVLLATIVIYLDGYINLFLLVYFDVRIKRHFLQIFCRNQNYADLRFDARSSSIQILQQVS